MSSFVEAVSPFPAPGNPENHVFITGEYIRAIIKCCVYRGIIRVKTSIKDIAPGSKEMPEYEEYRGRHTPLVSDDLWYRANKMLGPDKKRPRCAPSRIGGRSIGLLQGILFCDCCDSAMTPLYTSKVQKSGKKHRYYRCIRIMGGGKLSGCSTKQISASAIESSVIAILQQLEVNPANFERLGLETNSSKRGEVIRRLNAEILDKEARIDEKRRAIDKLLAFVQQGTNVLTPDAVASATKLKAELASLEYELVQQQAHCHKLLEKTPALSELASAFGAVGRALQASEHRNRYDIFHLIIRSIGLRRVVIVDPAGERAGRRTFRMNVEFKTNEIMRFGKEGLGALTQGPNFAKIVLSTTFDVESNSARQRVTFLEQGYSFVAATFEAPLYQPIETSSLSENPVQRAARWKSIIDSRGITASQLATNENVSKGLVSQHLSLLGLPQLIVEFLKAGHDSSLAKKISLRELLYLCSLSPSDAATRFRERISGAPVQDTLPLSNVPVSRTDVRAEK